MPEITQRAPGRGPGHGHKPDLAPVFAGLGEVPTDLFRDRGAGVLEVMALVGDDQIGFLGIQPIVIVPGQGLIGLDRDRGQVIVPRVDLPRFPDCLLAQARGHEQHSALGIDHPGGE